MTYSFNDNYTNYSYQQPMGLGQNGMINVDAEKLKTEAKNNNNIVTNTLNDHSEKEKVCVAVATFASWIALCAGMAKFNKSCKTILKNGTPTSLLHKVQSGADKIGHLVEDNKVGKKIFSVLDSTKAWTKTHIVDKSKILSSIVNTPAQPNLAMPKSMLNGTLSETAQDAIEAIEKYYNKKGIQSEALESAIGLTSKMRKEQGSKETVEKLLEILKKLEIESKDIAIEVGPDRGLFRKVLERKVYPSELINKLNCLNGESIIGKTENLSRLGKKAPKAFLRVVEGLTNGTAGGRIAIGMQAMCYGDAIIRTAKAPKGEKKSTFAESIINDLSFYLMMPVGLTAIYGAGGTKYIGMNKAQVAEYRKQVAELTEKVKTNSISKADYKATVKHLKDMLKGDTKILKTDKVGVKFKKGITNIVNKPVKGLGKLFTSGLEQIPMYRGKDANIFIKANLFGRKCLTTTMDLFSRIPLLGLLTEGLKGKSTTVKGFGGGAMRFAAYMFLISPFLAKCMTKIGHQIFGRPTKSILDDDTENEAKNKPQEVFTEQVQPIDFAVKEQIDNIQRQDAEPVITPVINPTIKPATEHTAEAITAPATKPYIPSTTPVVLDNSALIEKFNSAMSNSYKLENVATIQANKKANRRTK